MTSHDTPIEELLSDVVGSDLLKEIRHIITVWDLKTIDSDKVVDLVTTGHEMVSFVSANRRGNKWEDALHLFGCMTLVHYSMFLSELETILEDECKGGLRTGLEQRLIGRVASLHAFVNRAVTYAIRSSVGEAGDLDPMVWPGITSGGEEPS